MKTTNPFYELEDNMFAALETYANVNRGSGHFSKTTSHLFEKARKIVIDHLGLDRSRYLAIFLTPRRAAVFVRILKPGSFKTLNSSDILLNLGVTAQAAGCRTYGDQAGCQQPWILQPVGTGVPAEIIQQRAPSWQKADQADCP